MADVRRTYVNARVAGAFQGLSGFLRNRKRWKNKVELENQLRQLEGYALHKPVRHKFPRRAIKLLFKYDVLSADLKDISSIAKYNNQNTFVLVCIDGFSKRAFVRFLKQKTGKCVLNALKSIFKEMEAVPRHFFVDQGQEWTNTLVQNYLKSKGVRTYHIYSHIKSSFAENFIKNMWARLARAMTQKNTLKITDILPKLVSSYNNSIHSTIKMAPNQVNKENEMQIWYDIYLKRYQQKPKGPPKFHVNDYVRISKAKAIFDKGYNPNWSEEIFRVDEIKATTPYTYHLVDLQGEKVTGGFYTEELDKAVLPPEQLKELNTTPPKSVYI